MGEPSIIDEVIDRILAADPGADPGTELEPEWKAIHRAADELLPSTTRLFDRAFNAGRRAINLDELEEAFDAGARFRVTALLLAGADRTREILEEDLPPQTLTILVAGAEATARSARARGSLFRNETIDQELPPPPLVEPRDPILEEDVRVAQDPFTTTFFGTNPRAINWAAAHSAGEIVAIDAETRRAIQQIVSDAFELGLTPSDLPLAGPVSRIRGISSKQQARRVRSLVGLTRRQLDAVDSLRAQMAARVRGTFKRAGLSIPVPPGGFSPRFIDLVARRYTERLNRGRALNISRTETITSANEGQRQLWLQAREDGFLTGGERREWIVTPDDRLCPICRAMAGQLRGLEESFDAGRFGKVMGPTAHPQCRCATGLISAEAAAARGTGSTPTLPSGAPVAPPGVLPGGGPATFPLPGVRATWANIPGAKLPRAAERRELVENALNRMLDEMPPALRARALETLNAIPKFNFQTATASTKNMAAVGRMSATGLPTQAPQLKQMNLQIFRPNEKARTWARGYQQESQRLITRRGTGEITADDQANILSQWRRDNPFPDQWRLATEEEFAATLTHELMHAFDFQAGTSMSFNPTGITKIWREANMQEEIWRAYWVGDMDVVTTGGRRVVRPRPEAIADSRFAYATSESGEGLAETMRLYFNGDQGNDGITDITALEWRQRYPELARWIEQNIIGTGG